MKRVIFFFGILALFSLFPLLTQAAPVGTFTHVMGTVDITSPGEAAKPAHKGYEVNVGDIVRTKAKAKAEITFIDGSVVRLAQKSRMKITEYMVTKDQRRASISLYRGKIRSMVKSVLAGLFGQTQRNRYEIRTPTAIVGVRGTDFFSYYLQGISGAVCKEGHVYGYPVNNPAAVKFISAGQALLIKSAEEIPVETPAPSDEIDDHENDTDPTSEGTGTGGETPADTTIAELILGTKEGGKTEIGVVVTEGGETTPEIPYEQPPLVVEGLTTFSADVPFGFLTGDECATLTGSIDNVTNVSTAFSLSGDAVTWPAGTWGGQFSVQDADPDTGDFMTDHDTGVSYAMNGTIQGVSGSWNAVVSSLYLGGGEAGYVYGTLSGDYNPVTYAFSGSGTALRLLGGSTHKSAIDPETGDLSMTGHLISWPYPLPILQSVTAGGAMTKGSASYVYSTGIDLGRLNPDTGEYEDSGGRKLGVFGVRTSGGTYSNPLSETAWQGLYGDYSSGSYYMLGDVYGTDDLAGHVGMAGFMVYMDPDYFGGIDVSYRGHIGSYESAGAGIYTLDPLAYSGSMTGTLYINDYGSMSEAGDMTALVGGLVSPWSNAYSSLLILGDYTGEGPGVGYLWNSEIAALDLSDSNNVLSGYAGGPWEDPGTGNGTLYGPAVAIYKDSSGNVGLLTASLSGDSYPGLGQWIASGTWTRTFKETVDPDDLDPDDWAATREDGLSATVVGDFGGSGEIYGEGDGETQFVHLTSEDRDLPWGVYNLKLGSPNTFSGKPEGDANWSAKAGGGFPDGEGFWLADVTGTWSDEGKITGNLSGTYLTFTQAGNIGGDLHGISGISGDWIGQSIGTYEGQTLHSSSMLSGNLYKLVKGTTYEGDFQAYNSSDPYWQPYGDYDYEYFISEGDSKLRYGQKEEYVYGGSDDEEIFLPDGTKLTVTNGPETVVVSTWTVGSLSPGYFTTLPGLPPGATDWRRNWYEEWVSDAIVENGTVGGIMGITGDLWSAHPSSPAGLSLMGTYEYTDGDPDQPFVFDMDIQAYDTTNGAYKGCLGGVMDEVAGGVYAVYVSPSQGAGVLEGAFGVINPAFKGNTYPGLSANPDTGMWEATGSIYPIEMVADIGFGPDSLDSNLQSGWIAGFLEGDFGNANSWIWSDWMWGTTYSIKGHDDWGVFGLKTVFDSALKNPAGTWSARAAGWAAFGEHDISGGGTAPDVGIWLTDPMSGTLTNGILYAPFSGKGLTYSKYLDIAGKIIGIEAPNVTHETYTGWMAEVGGYWHNSQALKFNGDLDANQYTMGESYHGHWDDGYSYYDYDYFTGTNSGWVSKTDAGTETHIDYRPDGTKRAWAEDGSGNLTYWEGVWDNTGSVKIAMLGDAPSGSDPVETGPSYQFWDSGDLEGYMGSLADLWAAGAGTPASTIFMGEYDWYSVFGSHTPRVFYGDIHSYNPYDHTYTIWNQVDDSQNGAYWGLMAGRTYGNGGVVDAGILGVYLDEDGNAGMVKGTVNGDLYADAEMWNGTGSLFPMKLVADTGLSLAHFDPAIADYLYKPPEESNNINSHGQFINGSTYEYYGDIHARDWRSSRIVLYPPDGSWLLVTRASLYGGTYSGTPSQYWYVPWYSDDGTVIRRAVTLSTPDATGSWSDGKIDAKGFGSWAHWDMGLTGVSGGDLKGTFDPNNFTWQAAVLWAGMDTNTFVSHTLTEEGRDKLRQLNIPYVNVGVANLAGLKDFGGGDSISVAMNGVTFYAFYNGSLPRIWATNQVSGSYTGTPHTNDPFALTQQPGGSNVNITTAPQFNLQKWDDISANKIWGARIQDGAGTVNTHNIVFRGEAAGGIDTGSSTFSGTASGTASPAPTP